MYKYLAYFILIFLSLFSMTFAKDSIQYNIDPNSTLTPLPDSSTQEGSSERIRELPIDDIYRGPYTLSFRLFESVKNDAINSSDPNQSNRMNFYYAPLYLLRVNTDGKLYTDNSSFTGGDPTEFYLQFEMYPEAPVLTFFASLIQSRYADYSFYNLRDLIHMLSVSEVKYSINDYENIIKIKDNKKCDKSGNIHFPPKYTITLEVPKEKLQEFKWKLDNGKISMDVTIRYNNIRLAVVIVSWKAEHILKSQRYNDLISGGGNYVNAKNIEEIIRETAASVQAYNYRDPNTDAILDTKSKDIFEKFLSFFVEKMVKPGDVAAMEADLLKGTGLEAKDFKPIVLMREMAEITYNAKTYTNANTAIRQFYTDHRTDIDTAANVGWGPFSTSFGYKYTTKDMQGDFFKNKTEYTEFLSRQKFITGQEVEIVELGINLLEKETFKNRVVFCESSINVFPNYTDSEYTLKKPFVKEDATDLKRTFPVGTIIPYAGKNIEDIPNGWLLCDGKKISTDNYGDLFRVIGWAYTYNENERGGNEFRLPLLAGKVLVGYGSPQQYNVIGKYGGEETVTLTIDNLPKHDHGIRIFVDNMGPAELAFNKTSLKSGIDSIRNFYTLTTGNNKPFDNRQPFVVVNYIIKY